MPVFRTVPDAQQGEIKLEAVHQPLYDRVEVDGAGTFSFFQNPAGRGRFETNLTTAGQLSWPKRFSIRALRQVPAFTALMTDIQTYLSDTVIRVTVGEKDYLILPAFLITAGVGLEAQTLLGAADPIAPANSAVYANLGRPNHQNIYSLIHSVYLPPVQNFAVTLEVGAAAAPANDVPVHLFLEGELLREIQ